MQPLTTTHWGPAWQVLLGIVFVSQLGVRHGVSMDQVTIQRDGKTLQVVGRVLVEAEDGGLMMEDQAGMIWLVQPGEIARRTSSQVPFKAWGADELKARLGTELPGFRFHDTAHYLICYNTSTAYAEWNGQLFERLYRAFTNYWSRRGIRLSEPDRPLIALVFKDRTSYTAHVQRELRGTKPPVGFYSLQSNRVNAFDLTGAGTAAQSRRISSTQQVNRVLAQPQAQQTVATIVHEATHQLVFNCGMQQRFADIPRWLSEGLAIYFETPDLKSKSGWRGLGRVNALRLRTFRQQMATGQRSSLGELLTNDLAFSDGERNTSALYAESWAFTFYLLKRYEQGAIKYLQILSTKEPLGKVTAEQRLADFETAFGFPPEQIEGDFLRYVARMR